MVTGIGQTLILWQHDRLHHLVQTCQCHCRKIGSAKTTDLMMLHLSGSSSPQRSYSLEDCCTQAYHISRVSFFIEGKDVGRCTVVSLRDHLTLYISFFVFLDPYFFNYYTTISANEFIVRHVLPRHIPGMMFPQLRHFVPDEEAAPQ